MPAPAGNKNAVGNKGGRGSPTKWKDQFLKDAEKLCLLGMTDAELAVYFEVCEDTINTWKKVHIKFGRVLKESREIADANVAKRLYKRAMGYSHPDTQAKWVESDVFDPDTETYRKEGRWEYAKLTKHYPPDTKAASMWLYNRQRRRWRDRAGLEIGLSKEQIELIINNFPNAVAQGIRENMAKIISSQG